VHQDHRRRRPLLEVVTVVAQGASAVEGVGPQSTELPAANEVAQGATAALAGPSHYGAVANLSPAKDADASVLLSLTADAAGSKTDVSEDVGASIVQHERPAKEAAKSVTVAPEPPRADQRAARDAKIRRVGEPAAAGFSSNDSKTRRRQFAVDEAVQQLGPLVDTIENGLDFDHSVFVFLHDPGTIAELDDLELKFQLIEQRRRALDYFDTAVGHGETWATSGTVVNKALSPEWKERRRQLLEEPIGGDFYEPIDEKLMMAYARCYRLNLRLKAFSVARESRLPNKVNIITNDETIFMEEQHADVAGCALIVYFDDLGSSFKDIPRRYKAPVECVNDYRRRARDMGAGTVLAGRGGSPPRSAQEKSKHPPHHRHKRSK